MSECLHQYGSTMVAKMIPDIVALSFEWTKKQENNDLKYFLIFWNSLVHNFLFELYIGIF